MIEDKTINKDFLNEARRIGDRLLAKAETDEPGMHWKTMTLDINGNSSFEKSENIYCGVSGIVLFFLELFKLTQDSRYMDAAKEGTKWVINYCNKNPSRYFAFFTGRMGVPYTLLQMYKFTGKKEYLENALAAARPCQEILEDNSTIDDLLGGNSGTLLGLLHLHAVSGEKWLLDAIDSSIRHLVDNANHGPTGLYWDRSPQHINGLCGFSHGAAGVGFVFLELGYYFQNEIFYRIAEQAFLYERYFFNQTKSRKNWPDLRKGIYTDDNYLEHQKAFLEGDLDFFTIGGDMNAWCHGAAGIGLSRLRAYQLLKKPIYKNEVQIAVEKTILTDIDSENPYPPFILCHGGGGSAELFLSAYQLFKDEKYFRLAKKIAVNALAFQKKHNHYLSGYKVKDKIEDTSLFMGNAGIGYFLLRMIDPLHVPSILAPIISSSLSPGESGSLSRYPSISLSWPDLQGRLLQKDFKRTFWVSREIMPRKLQSFLNENQSSRDDINFSPVKSFTAFIQKVSSGLPPKENAVLSDVFELELEKQQMDEKIKSHSLLNIKEKVLSQQAKKIVETDNRDFTKLTFQLEADVKLTATEWDWHDSHPEKWKPNLRQEKKQQDEEFQPILLQPTPLGIKEAQLSPFSYIIFYEFQEPKSVELVIRATFDAFESMTPQQEEMLKEKILLQIKEALLAGILIQVKPGE